MMFMLIRDANQIRKKESKNDIQKARIENLFNIRFQNDKEYDFFLNHLHRDIPFIESKQIIEDAIQDLIDSEEDFQSIIEDFERYIEEYIEEYKVTNGNVEYDDDMNFYKGMVFEAMEDGMRDIGDLEKVKSTLQNIVSKKYNHNVFRVLQKRKIKINKNKKY